MALRDDAALFGAEEFAPVAPPAPAAPTPVPAAPAAIDLPDTTPAPETPVPAPTVVAPATKVAKGKGSVPRDDAALFGAGEFAPPIDTTPAPDSPKPAVIPRAALPGKDTSSALGDLKAGAYSAMAGIDMAQATGAMNSLPKLDADIKNFEQKEAEAKAAGYPAGFNFKKQLEAARLARRAAEGDIVKSLGGVVDMSTGSANFPTNPAAEKFNNATTWKDSFDALLSDPYGVMRTTVVRSLPASSPSLVAGAIGSVAGTATMGPAGGVALGAAGLGLGSGATEVGNEAISLLAQKGANLRDPESVKKVFAANRDEIMSKLIKRAAVVGGVDAATALVSAGVGAKMLDATFGQKLLHGVVGTTIEAAGGAAGEAGAELAEGQQLQPGQILGEAVGEIGPGVATTIGGAAIHAATGEHPAATDVPPGQRIVVNDTDPKMGPGPRHGQSGTVEKKANGGYIVQFDDGSRAFVGENLLQPETAGGAGTSIPPVPDLGSPPVEGGGVSAPPPASSTMADKLGEALGVPPEAAPPPVAPPPAAAPAPVDVVPPEVRDILRQTGLPDDDINDIASNPALVKKLTEEAMAAGIRPTVGGATGADNQQAAAPPTPSPGQAPPVTPTTSPLPPTGGPVVTPTGLGPNNIATGPQVPPVVPGVSANTNVRPQIPASATPVTLPPDVATAGVSTPANVNEPGAANLNVPGAQPVLPGPGAPPGVAANVNVPPGASLTPATPPAPTGVTPVTPTGTAPSGTANTNIPSELPAGAPVAAHRQNLVNRLRNVGLRDEDLSELGPIFDRAAAHMANGVPINEAVNRAIEEIDRERPVTPSRRAPSEGGGHPAAPAVGEPAPSGGEAPHRPTEPAPSPGEARPGEPAVTAEPGKGVDQAGPQQPAVEPPGAEPRPGEKRDQPAAVEPEGKGGGVQATEPDQAVPAEGGEGEVGPRERTEYRSPTSEIYAKPGAKLPGETSGNYTKLPDLNSPGMRLYDNGGVRVGSDNKKTKPPHWLPHLQSIAEGLAEKFDLPPIKVWAMRKFGSSVRGIHYGYRSGSSMRGAIVEIGLKDDMSHAEAISTLLHEVGHSISWAKFRAAPEAVQKAIVKEWAAWKKYNKSNLDNITLDDLKPLMYALSQDPSVGQRSLGQVDPKWVEYATSFEEFFADQVRDWIITKQGKVAPKTPFERFIASLASAWQQLYRQATGYVPVGKEMEKFLSGLWDGSNITTDFFEREVAGVTDRPEAAEERISSRFPTTKRAQEDPLGHKLTIGIKAMQHSPKAFAHNMDLLKSYPGFVTSETEPDAIAADFIRHVEDNLLWLHDKMPAEWRDRAKRWYDGANRIAHDWSQQYGIPAHNIAGVLAALSPQKDWFQNVSLAERVLDIHQHFSQAKNDMRPTEAMVKVGRKIFGKEQYVDDNKVWMHSTYRELNDPVTKAMWLRAYDEAYNPRGFRVVSPEGDFVGKPEGNVAWGSLGEISKAIRSIGGTLREVSNAMGERNKVRSFFNNILDPNDYEGHGDVTIDTHAVAAGLMRPLSGSSAEVHHNFGTSPEVAKKPEGWVPAKNVADTGAMGTYGIHSEAYQRAAERRGILPRQMQSITWEAIRLLFNPDFKTAKNRDAIDAIWRRVENGEILPDEARQLAFDAGGGFDDPAWAGPDNQQNAGTARGSYEGKLAQTRLSGRPAGGVRAAAGGGRDRSSRGFTTVETALPGWDFGEENAAIGAEERRPSGRGAGAEEAEGTLRPFAASAPKLAGLPQNSVGPNARIVDAAKRYLAKAGIPERRQAEYVRVDVDRATRIAEAFEAMKHDPQDPATLAAYQQLAKETEEQFQAVLDSGLKISVIKEGMPDPYPGGPKEVLDDLKSGHIWLYPTSSGFGTVTDIRDNPLLAGTDHVVDGHPLVVNDLFRVVHDVFGHGREGVGFGASGEENTWQSHVRMFSPLAAKAMTTETRGQNSWVNYGPFGEQNRANQRETIYADQKIGLLPDWVMQDGVDDGPIASAEEAPLVHHGTPHTLPKEVEILHEATGKREFIPVGDGQTLPDNIVEGLKNGSISVREHPLGRFQLKYIGTGEGNQVFGWGMYFAEKRSIAEEYREQLTNRGKTGVTVGGEPQYDRDDFIEAVVEKATNGKLDGAQIPSSVYELIGDTYDDMVEHGVSLNMAMQGAKALNQPNPKTWNQFVGYIGKAGISRTASSNKGKLYTVRLNVDTATDLLYWDKTLNDQPDLVKMALYPKVDELANKLWDKRKALADRGYRTRAGKRAQDYTPAELTALRAKPDLWSEWTGERLYNALQAEHNPVKATGESAKAASLDLKGLGLKGIRYLDQGSREAGEGSYNYVVFDEDAMQIEAAEERTPSSKRMDRESRFNAASKAAAGVLPTFQRPSDPTFEDYGFAGLAKAMLTSRGRNDIRHMFGRWQSDSMTDVKTVQNAIKAAGGKVGLLSDAYQLSSLYHGKTGNRIEHLIQGKINPILNDMGRAGIDQARMNEVLTAQHAEERNKAILAIDPSNAAGSGMTDAEAQRIRATITPTEQQFADAIRKIIRDTNQEKWDAGLLTADAAARFGIIPKNHPALMALLTPQEIAAIPTPWTHYVPLRGWEGEIADGSPNTGGSGFSAGGSEFKQAFGRHSKSDGPMAYIFNDALASILKQEKNTVAMALYRLAMNNPNPEMWEVNKTEAQKSIDPKTGLLRVRFVHNNFDSSKPNVVTVKIGGKERHIEIFHSGLAAAMNNLTSQSLGKFFQVIGQFTRLFSSLNTSLNPEWVVSNVLRDIQTALVQVSDTKAEMQSAGFAPAQIKAAMKGIRSEIMLNWRKALMGSFKGMRRRTTTDPWQAIYEDFDKNGGRVNWIDYRSVEDFKRDIDRMVKAGGRQNIFGQMMRAVRGIGSFIETFNGAAENAIRVSTYAALVKRGVPKQTAASVARELTVNFNRKGRAGPVMNTFYAFFNASVQGNVRFFQALARSNTARVAMMGAVGVGLIEPIMAKMFDPNDDDWYERIPDYIRNRNFIIPTGGGEDDYIKIPIPYGLNLFKVLGNTVGRLGQGKISPLDAGIEVVSALSDVANPLGSSNIANMLAPTILDPVVSLWSNTSDMSGRPIAPDNPYNRKPDSEQYTKNATDMAINLSALLNTVSGGTAYEEGKLSFSPNTLDYVFDTVGGGLLRFTKKAIDATGQISGLAERPFDISRIPFAGTIWGKAGDFRAMSGEYYGIKDEALQASWGLQAANKAGDRDAAAKIRADQKAALAITPMVKAAEKQLKTLKDQETKILNNVSIDRAARMKQMENIRNRQQKIEDGVLKRWRELNG